MLHKLEALAVLFLSLHPSDAYNPTGRGARLPPESSRGPGLQQQLRDPMRRSMQKIVGMEQWYLEDINRCFAERHEGVLKCEVTPDKGRILRATRSFQPGDVIYEEDPLIHVTEDEQNGAFQLLQRICSEREQWYYEPLWYWAALCSLTNSTLKNQPSVGFLPMIEEDQQKKLLSLFHEPVSEASEQVHRIVSELQLQVEARLVEELLQVWLLNCFCAENGGYSVFFVTSFFSHSCLPNACHNEFDNNSFSIEAARAINAGDEVFLSYLEEPWLYATAEVRQNDLEESKSFRCACERCAPSSSHPNEDPCRGIRCESCGKCTIFYRLQEEHGEMLQGVKCKSCGFPVSASRAHKVRENEKTIHLSVRRLDRRVEEHDEKVSDVMPSEEAQWLLAAIDGENALIGPQHWLCYKMWHYLEDWYLEQKPPPSFYSSEDIERFRKLRVEYEARAYPKAE